MMLFETHQTEKNKPVSRGRIRTARLVAIVADLLQIGLFPIFGEGLASPLDEVLDVGVCLILTSLVGCHFAFLPTFVVELVPIADLIPTWTIAVFLATRQKQKAPGDRASGSDVTITVDAASAPERRPQKLLPDKGEA